MPDTTKQASGTATPEPGADHRGYHHLGENWWLRIGRGSRWVCRQAVLPPKHRSSDRPLAPDGR